MYRTFFKRCIDFIISAIALVILSPIFLLVMLILAFSNRGKIFFLQRRPGRGERIFSIIKFKTMNDRRGPDGELLRDKDRLTPMGKLVRKTSLDEIPQFINILKGDMSLIGPRPLLLQYLPYYTETERRRHSVRPGITGLAQISGRNNLDWDERLRKDVEYVENLSIALDARIFVITIINVLRSKDVVVDTQSLMPSLDEYRKNG